MFTTRSWQTAVLSGAVLMAAGSVCAEDMAPASPPSEQKAEQPTESKEQPKAEGERKDGPEGDRARRGEEMRKRFQEALFKDITLSDEQQAKVKEVMAKGRAEREAWMQEHGEELRKIRTQMQEAREAGDEEGVRDARETLQALMKDSPRPERYYDEVKALLTEEQAAQFAKNTESLRQRWRDFRGPGGPDGERRGKRAPDGEAKPSEGEAKPAERGPSKAKGDKLDL